MCIIRSSRSRLAEGFRLRLESMLKGERAEFYQTWRRLEDGSSVVENIRVYPM